MYPHVGFLRVLHQKMRASGLVQGALSFWKIPKVVHPRSRAARMTDRAAARTVLETLLRCHRFRAGRAQQSIVASQRDQ
jgi:hypothetical protein